MIWLTNFGLLEKGRMIEIEALYVSLTALAFICWLSWWKEPGRRWLTWTVPWIFLGLALLAKGPLALLFFYAVVLAILWQAKELRELRRWPHLVGLILMLAIFGAWAVPYLQMTEAGHVASVWSKQFSGRVTDADFKLGDWLLNIPRGIAYLLPWVVLLPFARFALLEDEKERKLCRALSLGVAVPFVVVNLMPGALPRYTMPLLAPAIWLLAIFIRSHALLWPQTVAPGHYLEVAGDHRGDADLFARDHSASATPRESSPDRRASSTPRFRLTKSLYAVDPDYQPYLFYLRRPIVYVSEVERSAASRALSSGPAGGRKGGDAFGALGAATGGADPAD